MPAPGELFAAALLVPAIEELFRLVILFEEPEVFVLFAEVPVLLFFDDVSPLFEEALVLLLFDELLPLELLAFDALPLFLAFEEAPSALLDFDDLPALSVAFVPAFPEVLAFDEELFPPPLSISLTASTAIFKAPAAAPFAAPVRISPAASLTFFGIIDDELFLGLFDFVEVDFVVVDFVVFLLSFFAAILLTFSPLNY